MTRRSFTFRAAMPGNPDDEEAITRRASEDLKWKVVRLTRRGLGQRDVARLAGVSKTTVQRILERHREERESPSAIASDRLNSEKE